MTLTYEQVIKRNRRHRDPRVKATDRALARAEGKRGQVHLEPHHRETEQLITFGGGWKQPGRKFGPSPVGPDHPKANKVTDRDGNPRIAPLHATDRLIRYWATGKRKAHQARPEDAINVTDGRRGAYLMGVTFRQRRRIVHKANHASAPFGKRVS